MFNASRYVHYTPDVNVKVLSLLWSADGRDRVPGPVQGRVQLAVLGLATYSTAAHNNTNTATIYRHRARRSCNTRA